jgi:hypothetical protein
MFRRCDKITPLPGYDEQARVVQAMPTPGRLFIATRQRAFDAR